MLVASPALAHTRAGVASDWSSQIVEVPEIEGIDWVLYPAGEYLSLTNDSGKEVTVLGYFSEPYLRIGPDGVHRNANSPTTYLNARRDGDVAVPPRADADGSPEWIEISEGSGYVWYDHRTHRMEADGPWGRSSRWQIPFAVDGERHSMTGRLLPVAGPSWWFPLLAALLVTSPVLLTFTRRDGALRPAAVVVMGVATFNLVHLPDEVLALPLSAVDVAFGLLHNVLFIAVGLIGAAMAYRGRSGAGWGLFAGSLAVAFHQGFLQLGQLGASQLPTVWPTWVIRLAVAASVAQFVWVVILLTFEVRTREGAGQVRAPGMAPG